MSEMRISNFDDFGFDRSLVPMERFPQRDRLFDWFEEHMRRIEDDFARNRSSLMPFEKTAVSVFDPLRRRRVFDTLFHDSDDFVPRVVENRTDNALEYHIPTGAGNSFKPEDLQVNVRGRDIEVKARREEKSDDGNAYALREVRRVVRVPEGVDVDKVAAEMRHNGKIIVKAPMSQPALTDTRDHYRSTVPLRVNRVL
ncbi:heat shock protein Hsp-16.2-like [Galendromus occidentalis]|uniref:Heat shock protein Hsp-16.2-like n=1 Tax=Galendromus occidentalis TaxID=34638 RepID=A0AAJ7L5V7_9ACAR|nr:heat shock protein Hsp-16.2-like [Galendromus occidentalis]